MASGLHTESLELEARRVGIVRFFHHSADREGPCHVSRNRFRNGHKFIGMRVAHPFMLWMLGLDRQVGDVWRWVIAVKNLFDGHNLACANRGEEHHEGSSELVSESKF